MVKNQHKMLLFHVVDLAFALNDYAQRKLLLLVVPQSLLAMVQVLISLLDLVVQPATYLSHDAMYLALMDKCV
jgi:hypothetical protein